MPGATVLDPSIIVTTYTGSDLLPYLDKVARLRIEVFRAYPYLYEGNMAYERDYLSTYLSSPEAAIVIASEGDKVIGASTCIPLQAEPAAVQAPFIAKGYEPSEFYYYGESVLLPEYRRKGVGVAFFEHRERKARSLERFKWVCFCGVERPADHPLRPADYVPLNHFWRRRGFQETDLVCYMSWQEITEEQESPKPLRFWIKEL
jgi:GNAT superfamily N-acetyltransferase